MFSHTFQRVVSKFFNDAEVTDRVKPWVDSFSALTLTESDYQVLWSVRYSNPFLPPRPRPPLTSSFSLV